MYETYQFKDVRGGCIFAPAEGVNSNPNRTFYMKLKTVVLSTYDRTVPYNAINLLEGTPYWFDSTAEVCLVENKE